MPIYEFECSDCKNIEEIILPITSDVRKIECSECKNGATRKISNSSFHLKGDGWFKDGYTKNKNSEAT